MIWKIEIVDENENAMLRLKRRPIYTEAEEHCLHSSVEWNDRRA